MKRAEPKATFRTFCERIAQAQNREDAIQNIFYGQRYDDAGNVERWGVDIAFQREKITWAEHQILLQIIEKLAE